MEQEPAKTEKTSPFREAYNELNESRKARLRADFITDHGYKSFDTFYRKLSGISEIYPNEKKYIAEKMNLPVEQLFPNP